MLKILIKLLNGMVSEAELVMSASLFSLLEKMKHPIAKLILDIHQGKIDIGDNSYVDVHPEKLGDITMLSHRRLERIPQDEIWSSRSRVDSGVGKLVRALLLKYDYKADSKGILKKEGSEDVSGRDIELFVSEFKALQQAGDEPDSNFKIVSGEEIRKWYLQNNYMDDNGTLGGSCMRYSKCQSYLDIYCKEPKVKMLIYTDLDDSGEEKLLGRALIWEETYIKHPDKEDEMIIFMDRIYYNETHLEETFKKYAWDNGWWCKVQQSYMNRKGIANGTDEMNAKMYVKLTKNYYNELTPYLDTFAYMKEATGTIWNYEISSTYKILTDTDGNLRDEDEDEDYCDSCGGDRRWDCGECYEGKVECGNCTEGTYNCSTCDGDYDSVGCNLCDGTGKCYTCDGDMKVVCSKCEGVSAVQKVENFKIGEDSDGKTMYDILRDKFIEVDHIDPDKVYDYILSVFRCKSCSDGYQECACAEREGQCYRCQGEKTTYCDDCDEGRATCEDCDGNGDVDCDSCGGDGYFECNWCL